MADAAPVEKELKLILPGIGVEQSVVDSLCRSGYLVEKTALVKNEDTYLDSSDWALLKNKLSLRYRLAGQKAEYTLKGTNGIENGIAQRSEREIALDKPLRDPARIPVKPLKQEVEQLISPHTLLEQLHICTDRQTYQVRGKDGARFEMAFDSSGYYAGAVNMSCPSPASYELEAELLEGSPGALEELKAVLLENFAFPPATESKLASAMEALHIKPIVKKVPDSLKLKPGDSQEVALKKIMNVEFHWLQAQLPGVKDDRDPEFVHQARVATRRMRSAFILLRSAVPAESADYFEKDLQRLGRLFGAVRDLDVFIINLRTYREKLERFPKQERKSLKKVIEKERRAPLRALQKSLASSSFHTFERRMEQFMTLPGEGRAALPGSMTMQEAAPPAIKSRLADVMAQHRKVTTNPVLTEYHCLRIKAKRLRYALEFMAPLYGGAFEGIIPITVEIHDSLGELQDTVFNKGLIKRLLKKQEGKASDPGLVFTLGEIYQYQGEIAREKRKSFTEIWRRFARRENLAALKAALEKRQAAKESRT